MGIKISNLLQDAAFDWKNVVDQLVDVQRSATIKPVETEIARNEKQVAAIAELEGLLETLKDSVQAMRSDNVFSLRTVSSASGTTWKSTSSSNAAIGSYTFDVTQLATKAKLTGGAEIGSALHNSSDVSSLTLSTLRTATAVTAGTFSVNGQPVTVSTADSLEEVFQAISDATGGAVTASYAPGTDKVTLASAGEIVLGAANDTSNFFSVFKLANNGTGTVTSASTLGTVRTTAPLASAGLAAGASGAGSFKLNGVEIAYDTATDSLAGLVSRINQSGAGVSAAYDSANDRFTLTNTSTGDVGLGATNDTGNLLAALGLTPGAGATLTRGKNALFSLNGGAPISSTSNTLTQAVHGVSGLSVTVNTATEQTLQVESDAATMQSYITDFVDAFNAVQSFIDSNTKVTIAGTKVTTSTLTGNYEIERWGSSLRALAFGAVPGLSGTIDQLADLGLDFDGTNNQLKLVNGETLAAALTERPDEVRDFFLAANTGFVSRFYGSVSNIAKSARSQQSTINKTNDSLTEQLERLESRLSSEEARLTEAFIKMQEAQSAASSQAKTLENAFFKDND